MGNEVEKLDQEVQKNICKKKKEEEAGVGLYTVENDEEKNVKEKDDKKKNKTEFEEDIESADIDTNSEKKTSGIQKENEELKIYFEGTETNQKIEKNEKTSNEKVSLEIPCSVQNYHEKSEYDKVKLTLTWLATDDKNICQILNKQKKLNIISVRPFTKYDLNPSFYCAQFKLEILREYVSGTAYKHLEKLISEKTEKVPCFSCSQKFNIDSAVICESCLNFFDPKCSGSGNRNEYFHCATCIINEI